MTSRKRSLAIASAGDSSSSCGLRPMNQARAVWGDSTDWTTWKTWYASRSLRSIGGWGRFSPLAQRPTPFGSETPARSAVRRWPRFSWRYPATSAISRFTACLCARVRARSICLATVVGHLLRSASRRCSADCGHASASNVRCPPLYHRCSRVLAGRTVAGEMFAIRAGCRRGRDRAIPTVSHREEVPLQLHGLRVRERRGVLLGCQLFWPGRRSREGLLAHGCHAGPATVETPRSRVPWWLGRARWQGGREVRRQ